MVSLVVGGSLVKGYLLMLDCQKLITKGYELKRRGQIAKCFKLDDVLVPIEAI